MSNGRVAFMLGFFFVCWGLVAAVTRPERSTGYVQD